jgi:transcriptional regulator with XRE-family HTH domain
MVSPAGTGPGGRDRRPRPLLRTTLGDVLRRTRLAQRRTLADVARAAKVSLPYLSELERGRKEASSEILAAICSALRVELADLLAETGRRLAGDPARRLASDPARQLAGDPSGRLAHPRSRQPGRGELVRLDDIRDRRTPLTPPAPEVQDAADIARPGPASDDARCLLAA